MRCKGCDYDLKNLTEHRCPECGRAFDPNDEKTYDAQTEIAFFTPLMVVATFISCAAIWYLVRSWSYRPDPGDPNNGEGLSAAMSGCMAVFLIGPIVYLLICIIRSIQLRLRGTS